LCIYALRTGEITISFKSLVEKLLTGEFCMFRRGQKIQLVKSSWIGNELKGAKTCKMAGLDINGIETSGSIDTR
jgi:hypothetical protein